MTAAAPPTTGGQLGRYELHGAIARGGMATVYVARMSGAAGFARTVAIKRLHPHLAADPNFSAMFIDEARLAARIRHPNVIDTLDVVADGGELFLVMDFVLGETLAKLVRSAATNRRTLPVPVISSIIIGALEGLHAAHEATNERGEPLGIVHRDISPQNILVARDGVARVLDFGVAKAAGRVQETEGGELKGKLAYMAPEQLTRKAIDRRCDVFAMGIVLWEALTLTRLFAGDDAASTLYSVINEPITPPSKLAANIPPALDEVVLKALERDVTKRFATAQEMAVALEAACPPAPTRHAGKWVEELAADAMKIRADIVRAIDNSTSPPSGPTSVSGDDLTGGNFSPLVSSPRIAPPATESWRHLPAGAPVHNAGMSGVSSVSSVTHASGVSNASATSHVTAHAHTLPANEEAAKRSQAVKLAIIGGSFGAVAIIGIALAIVALNARARAAATPAVTSAAVAVAPAAPPSEVPAPSVTAAVPAPTAEEPDLELPAESPVEAGAPVAAVAPAPQPVYTGPAGAPKTVKSAKPTAADCADPFTIDANGIKRPKPQCFGAH